MMITTRDVYEKITNGGEEKCVERSLTKLVRNIIVFYEGRNSPSFVLIDEISKNETFIKIFFSKKYFKFLSYIFYNRDEISQG